MTPTEGKDDHRRPTAPSPSVCQSVRIIVSIDSIISDMLCPETLSVVVPVDHKLFKTFD